MVLLLLLLFAGGDADVLVSRYASSDVELTADPQTPFWKGVPGAVAANDRWGKPLAGHSTEIRSRWTGHFLYLLFICPYQELFLHPQPSLTTETDRLWEWDVAEAFIGSDAANIHRYKEFEVSPQGEWVDLDIDRKHPIPDAWKWNSGFRVKARLDRAKQVWYGEMRIPISSIDPRPPQPGNRLRVNLYRIQGPPRQQDDRNSRVVVCWRPTHQANNHVPESFGSLRLDP